MPEGHKTHFLARRHRDLLAGHRLRVTSPQGRFDTGAREVDGKELTDVTAAGKHLFYHFRGDRLVHIHLGRYGKFRESGVPPPPPRGKVRVRFESASVALDLNGPSTCRVIRSDAHAGVLSRLGPDPLAGGRGCDVWEKVKSSGQPIGGLLLDQSVVAGVGNILRAEVLFETGIDPRTPGRRLSRESFDELWRSLRRMMNKALRYGKIISVTSREAGRPLASLDGRRRFRIYGKSGCPNCGTPIESLSVAGRKLYVCPACQLDGDG